MARTITPTMAEEYKELCELYNEKPFDLIICGEWVEHYDELKLRKACDNLSLIVNKASKRKQK